MDDRKLTACFWFDTQAEEAARYYTGIFKDSKLGAITYYPTVGQEVTGKQPGSVLTVDFELNGQAFVALSGGPDFKFTEATSFMIPCEDQAEVDYYWERLTAGGDESAQQCGWLKDKYGVSWQVVPRVMDELLSDPDTTKSNRAFQAMLQMKKIDIAAIKRAYEGETSAART